MSVELTYTAEFEDFFDLPEEAQYQFAKDFVSDGLYYTLHSNGKFDLWHMYIKSEEGDTLTFTHEEDLFEYIDNIIDENESPEGNIKNLKPYKALFAKALAQVNALIDAERQRPSVESRE